MLTSRSLPHSGRIAVLILLGVGAFALRLSFSQSEPIFPDSSTYLSISRAVLEGHLATTFRGGVPTFFPPLYPALTALVSLLYPDIETSAVLVSAVAGAVTVLVTWWLARAIFGLAEGWLAASLTAVSPLLVHWSAHMLTESLFTAIAVAAAAAAWHAIRTPSSRWFLAAGVLCGLAYLTRIIGVILLPALGVWIALPWFRPDADRASRLRFLAAFSLGFLVVSSPYWIHLHENMGGWTFWGSYGSASEVISHGGNPEFGDSRPSPGASAPLGMARNVLHNVVSYSETLWAATSISIAFAIVGLLARKAGGDDSAIGRYWLASIIGCYVLALLIVGGVPSSGERIRYLSPILPILFILSSRGLTQVAERVRRLRVPVMVVGLGVILVSFWLQMSSLPGLYFSPAWTSHPPSPHRVFGLWMKDHLPRPLAIMARKPYIPYFAGGTWYMTPLTLGDTLSLSRNRQVEYLVVDRLSDPGSRPEVATLLDPERAPASFELLAVQQLPDGQVLFALYRIKAI